MRVDIHRWACSARAGLGFVAPATMLVLALASCGGGDGTVGGAVNPPPAQAQALTVVGGFGPATVPASGAAEVWANVLPPSEVVTRWVGAALLGDADEWHASVAAASSPVTVTAERQTVAVTFDLLRYPAPTTITKTARLHIPASPKGVILFMHGTGGNSSFIDNTEARYVALKAISRGYAVLAPEAEEAVAGDLNGDGKQRWNVALTADNLDLQALDALLASLVANGRLPAMLPRYVLGMSNGGSMAVALGALAGNASATQWPQLRFKAVVSFCAEGLAGYAAVTRVPTAWLLCGNDDNAEVNNTQALANSAALSARGVPSLGLLHPATPLYDERFARVLGITVAQSRSIAAELRAAGFVDTAQLFNISTDDMRARVLAAPNSFPTVTALSTAQQKDVLSQIAVMRAQHEMFSDWASKAVRWFETYP
jgi:dienelactone hydrolase